MSITPKKEGAEKVQQDSFNLSLTSSDPSSFPITYDDDMWVVVTADSSLYDVVGAVGQFSQRQINDALAFKAMSEADITEISNSEIDQIAK